MLFTVGGNYEVGRKYGAVLDFNRRASFAVFNHFVVDLDIYSEL
jgi:hypothetical protein